MDCFTEIAMSDMVTATRDCNRKAFRGSKGLGKYHGNQHCKMKSPVFLKGHGPRKQYMGWFRIEMPELAPKITTFPLRFKLSCDIGV